MNNYNWLEQQLHRLALSSKFIRKASFDSESTIISAENGNDNNIFISGLARSGTTSLLYAVHRSDQFASLSYADMPFILAPNLWSKASFYKNDNVISERAHNDGIYISKTSPEAFEEIFWNTFDDKNKDSLKKFKIYVELVKKRYKKQRYLSKNNQNIKRLGLIREQFPDSKILITFRNPIQHAYSLLTQHIKFINVSKKDKFIKDYMKWTGHTEFGPNYYPASNENLVHKNDLEIDHWLEQWLKVYKDIVRIKSNRNTLFICYEKLCNEEEYWSNILESVEISHKYEYKFKESKKNIDINVNQELLDMAVSTYQELMNKN